MTVVKVYKKDDNVLKIDTLGHTGFDIEGQDIVCAAVSSIIQTAALGLLSVAKVNIKTEKDEKKAFYSIELPQSLNLKKMKECQIILTTAIAGVNDLAVEYSRFIKLEVKDHVY